MGNSDWSTALAAALLQTIVSAIAIDLQDTVKSVQEGFGILSCPIGGVEIDHAWWIGPIPCPVIARQRP